MGMYSNMPLCSVNVNNANVFSHFFLVDIWNGPFFCFFVSLLLPFFLLVWVSINDPYYQVIRMRTRTSNPFLPIPYFTHTIINSNLSRQPNDQIFEKKKKNSISQLLIITSVATITASNTTSIHGRRASAMDKKSFNGFRKTSLWLISKLDSMWA
jgi:hypothetical protein